MQDADSRPVADRAESARHARSNYFLYLAGTGAGVFAGVFFEFFDTGGQELAGSTMLMVGGLIGLFAFIVMIIGVARAYMGRKKANEETATHFRVQIRTFWICWLYSVATTLAALALLEVSVPQEAIDVIDHLIWVALIAWFVVRCIKGLKCLGRREPYPNPGTWLW